jgi:Bacterial PH domain/Short C-terminal domain
MANRDKLLAEAKRQIGSGESILAGIFGVYDKKVLGNDFPKDGVFLATDKRLFLFVKNMFGYDMEIFLYSNISALEVNKGLLGHTVTIFAAGNQAKMKWVTDPGLQNFVDYIRSQINKPATGQSETMPKYDITEQIIKLSTLRDKGILTEEEFQIKKTEMLSRL